MNSPVMLSALDMPSAVNSPPRDKDVAFGSLAMRRQLIIGGAAAGLLGSARSVHACSRSIVTPLAPTGALVRLEDEKPRGVVPDLLAAVTQVSRCRFETPVVPRSRLYQMFFETGTADLLFPAVRHPLRDQKGRFVALVQSVPALVTLDTVTDVPRSVSGLLTRRDWHGVVVKTYTFGNLYDDLVKDLDRQRRLTQVGDLATSLRMLLAGRVPFALLPPSVAYGESQFFPAADRSRLRYQLLEGLPSFDVGVYVSRTSLSMDDQQSLIQELHRLVTSGLVERVVRMHYPKEVIALDLTFPRG